MSARAGIVVTGTEVLTGRVQDRNGPWLADRLFELGVDLAHITICGDRAADMEAQLRFLASEGVDLIVTSGGLGPTADDLTMEIVAQFAGRELVLDEALERRIAEILKPLMSRWPDLDPDASEGLRRECDPRRAAEVGAREDAPGSERNPDVDGSRDLRAQPGDEGQRLPGDGRPSQRDRQPRPDPDDDRLLRLGHLAAL